MRQNNRLWFIALAFLMLCAALIPSQANATVAQVDPCPQVNGKPSKFDQDVQNSTNNWAQNLYNISQNINTLFPTAPSTSACITNLVSAFGSLSSAANAGGLLSASTYEKIAETAVQAVASSIVSAVIETACNAAMAPIQAGQGLINSLAICIPSPDFGASLFNFNLQLPCIGTGNIAGLGTTQYGLTDLSTSTATPFGNTVIQGAGQLVGH